MTALQQPTPLLDTAFLVEGDHVVLRVAGELDVSTEELARAAAINAVQRAASRPGVRAIVVDMSGVEFFGASGVTVLLEAVGLAARHELPLSLVPSRTVAWVLSALELEYAFRVESVRAAVMPLASRVRL